MGTPLKEKEQLPKQHGAVRLCSHFSFEEIKWKDISKWKPRAQLGSLSLSHVGYTHTESRFSQGNPGREVFLEISARSARTESSHIGQNKGGC
jgi:hypothetical protein